jgi:hypothetical protein
MDLGSADGDGQRQAARQSTQIVVQQCCRDNHPARFRSHFKLKPPQPYLLTLLASGWSPIYPCHVPRAKCVSTYRHWAVQIRRFQAQRIYQGSQEPV